MALPTGTRLGAYAVLSPLGAGGMGEVYRASDTRLDRLVALKILPREVSDHPARRQRFEREARAIASLSHPHICTLFDVGEADGALFLVMEYLEGETLAQRLRRGAIPVQDVLRYAIEIADALDHAHRDGIIHRDLKPANIMLTRSGTKLLDFGLAKALAPAEESRSGVSAMSAHAGAERLTDTEPLTEEGTILGTVHYMAPEQLEARETDARTDIFAFGAVVYEMLSGRKAFDGGSKVSVMAAILEHDPPPIATRSSDVSETGPVSLLLDHVVARCLAKDPDERWQSAGDLMRELRWIAGSGTQLGLARTSAQGSRRGRLVAGALIGLTSLATLAVVTTVWRPAAADERAVQFVVAPPDGSAFNAAPAFMAVSPDGKHLAFSAANRGAGMALWLRSFDSLDLRQLTIEEGAQPFWSPDGLTIAFFAVKEYKKIDVRTGRVQTLINARGQSGTWNRAGVIVMKLADRPVLSRFSVDGGTPTPATTLDAAREETLHTWPQFLPDGRRFLYVARSARPEYDRTICVGSLDSTSRTVLFRADSHAVYASGHLLFMRGSTLTAQPFDATSLRASGEPVPFADHVESNAFGNRGSFSVSDTGGVLAYRAIAETRLLWLDRAGRVLATIGPPGTYANPAVSPDGRRAAVARLDPATGAPDIWVIELARGILSRFTFDPSGEDMPLWSRDGSRIVFRAGRQPGAAGFFEQSSSGTGPEERLLGGLNGFANPLGWARQGNALVYGAQADSTLNDLWELPRPGDRRPVALLQTEFQEIQGQPSPDGRWLAYVSNESGQYEVYVRSVTGKGKWPVTATGGLEPKWRADGKELFYLAHDRGLMSVTLQSDGSALGVGTPTRLFETRLSTIPNTGYTRNQYDLTPDGQYFLINQPSGDAAASPITVIVNWPAALKK